MGSSSLSVLLLLCCLAAASEAATFQCTTAATCQSLIGYVSINATKYSNITSLFQVPFSAILGANNLSFTTPKDEIVKAGSTVWVPVPCKCSKGIGQSDQIPVYVVVPEDGLDAIARNKFDQFVNYTEIATANNITDPNNILVGQKLWIPLPCSCDKVEGEQVAHLAYRVASGDSVASIASKFGASDSTLLTLNGIADPKSLKADQTLDVPLKACQSSISSTSQDSGLLLPNNTYALTANDCVICSCSSSSYKMDCMLASNKSSSCHATTCNNGTLAFGSTIGSGCNSSTCAYSGYTNTSVSIDILTTTVTNQSNCTSGLSSYAANTRSSWMSFTILSLHMILIGMCFM